ncbi:MAG: hypothetical protein HZB31_15810 [Nitrospirae bacterium]|nr:hypothetical protein [Nitrospirota bacterium]
MTNSGEGRAEQDGHERSLVISLEPEASQMTASGNREVHFERAILTFRNVSDAELVNVVPHATLGQEGGTIQDISGALLPSVPVSIPPLGTVRWDLYDLLLTAHPGAASKLHMFGYRAALNWRFDLVCRAEYRCADSAASEQTLESRWTLQWTVPDASRGDVTLAIEEVII